MIHKVTKTYYSLSCDRCGCAFENDETDDVLFEDLPTWNIGHCMMDGRKLMVVTYATNV